MQKLRPWPCRRPPPRRCESGSGRDLVGAPPPQPPRRLRWCLRRPFLAHQRRGTGNTPTRVSWGPPPHTATRERNWRERLYKSIRDDGPSCNRRSDLRARTTVGRVAPRASSTGQSYPPAHVGRRLQPEEREDGGGEIDDLEVVGRNTRAIQVEERIGVGVHAGERAASEDLRARHGALRVVAVVEVHHEVGRLVDVRATIELVACEHAWDRAPAGGSSRAVVAEREQSGADLLEERGRLAVVHGAERIAAFAMQVD